MTANDRFVCQPYTSCMGAAAVFDATRLAVFREVVRRGSLSAAAQALNFTQPAVSRQIAALEREADAQLLERTPRGIRLTEAGRVLLGHAEAILDRMSAAHAQLESVARMAGGRLRIGAFQSATATVVARAIAAFAREHPNVEISLVEAVTRDAVARLRAGDIDLAVVTHFPDLDGTDAEVVDLVDDELLVALPATHRLAHKPRLRLRDLRDETWIEAGGGTQPTLLAAAARIHGFEPRVSFAAEQWLSKQGLVAAGVGITLIPGLAIASARDDIVLRSLGPHGPRRRVVVLLPAGYRAPAVEPFVALLHHEAAAHGAALDERARRIGAAEATA